MAPRFTDCFKTIPWQLYQGLLCPCAVDPVKDNVPLVPEVCCPLGVDRLVEAACLLVEGASCPGASCLGVEGVPLEVEGGRRGGREVCRGIQVVEGRVAAVQTQMLQRERKKKCSINAMLKSPVGTSQSDKNLIKLDKHALVLVVSTKQSNMFMLMQQSAGVRKCFLLILFLGLVRTFLVQ